MNVRFPALAALVALTATSAFGSERIVRGLGPGYFEAAALSGPAASAVRDYISNTYVECETRKGAGLCNLRASTESLQLVYAGPYAVAIIAFDNDMGNRPAMRVAMWRRVPAGYAFAGFTEKGVGYFTNTTAAAVLPRGMRIAVVEQGPNDAFCCPTTRSAYAVTETDGEIRVQATDRAAQAASAAR